MMTDSFDVKIVNRRQRLLPENGLLTQREVDKFCKVRKPELNRNFNMGHQSIQRKRSAGFLVMAWAGWGWYLRASI